jgi:hypothetical protein
MSTPPLPDDTLGFSPKPPKRSLLQKITIAMSLILVVTFGLCTVTVTTTDFAADYIIVYKASIAIEAVCILSLVVIAIIVIIRALQGDY